MLQKMKKIVLLWGPLFVRGIVVKFKTFRIKFKKVQKSSRKNKVHKSS